MCGLWRADADDVVGGGLKEVAAVTKFVMYEDDGY